MSRDVEGTKYGRGYATGRGFGLHVRLHPPELRAIDGWIDRMGGELSRPEALRRLAARALQDMGYRPAGRRDDQAGA